MKTEEAKKKSCACIYRITFPDGMSQIGKTKCLCSRKYDGNGFEKFYDNMRDAAEQSGVRYCNIWACVMGRVKKSCGFCWEKVDDQSKTVFYLIFSLSFFVICITFAAINLFSSHNSIFILLAVVFVKMSPFFILR